MPNHILIVTYDLKGSEGGQANYEKVFEILKACPTWCHYIDSTWLVFTEESPQSLAERIRPSLAPGDRMLITEMGSAYWGLLPKEGWEWIKRVQAAGKGDA